MIEDRDVLITIVNIFGSLAKKLTGQTFTVCIEDKEGYEHYSYPSGDKIIFTDEKEVAVSQCDLPAG